MSRFYDIHIPITPAWKMALVRIFGKRYLQIVKGNAFEYYVWRGRSYIVRVE